MRKGLASLIKFLANQQDLDSLIKCDKTLTKAGEPSELDTRCNLAAMVHNVIPDIELAVAPMYQATMLSVKLACNASDQLFTASKIKNAEFRVPAALVSW